MEEQRLLEVAARHEVSEDKAALVAAQQELGDSQAKLEGIKARMEVAEVVKRIQLMASQLAARSRMRSTASGACSLLSAQLYLSSFSLSF